MARSRKNSIGSLKDENGQWQEDEEVLKEMIRQFFLALYTKGPTLPLYSSGWSFPGLDRREVISLNKSVSAIEIEQTLFQMRPHKAPGPDGFPPSFFQRYWHVVGPSVVEFLQSIFTKGVLPMGLNEATICLIPKCQSLETLGQFWPIFLCNVLAKIILKVLVNRLKLVMMKLAGPK